MHGPDFDRLLAVVAVLLALDVGAKWILALVLVYLWWRSER